MGNGTHVGLASIDIVFDACQFLGPTIGISAQGHTVITAANGDELHMTFTMALHPPGILFDLDPIDFTGGTGRFANAAGHATAPGSIDNTTHQGHYDLTGLITRPNH